jgi:hypothetical protein
MAWWHDNQTTWPWEEKIFVQIFNADGTRRGDEFVAHTTDTRGNMPAMAALPNGQFVVVWAGGTPAGVGTGSDIWAQVFNADGSKAGDQLLVNTTRHGHAGRADRRGSWRRPFCRVLGRLSTRVRAL